MIHYTQQKINPALMIRTFLVFTPILSLLVALKQYL